MLKQFNDRTQHTVSIPAITLLVFLSENFMSHYKKAELKHPFEMGVRAADRWLKRIAQ